MHLIIVELIKTYYYQGQGELECTGREKCFFVTFIENEFNIEVIRRDRKLWQFMLPKLKW